MLTFATLVTQCRALSQMAFERRYPHAWLLREASTDELGAPCFKTAFGCTSPGTSCQPTQLRHRISSAMTAASFERCELLPVTKRPDSPWQDRILIGRALNSDIVLRDPSVSKVHAHISVLSPDAPTLHARKSTNGTFLNDRLVSPAGDGVPLQSGDILQLGNVVCELIVSADIYRLAAR
ncbi:FHA domain-containing protein [Sorangium sp. So ce1036]|uniref:FHA domain-containing protein n=1 Tax=Sorangium sp. So ce1036 TaxID=3133328 RepID=UPI003F05F84B